VRRVSGELLRRLLALGVDKRHAILTAISSKSYWRMSKTLATPAGDDQPMAEGTGLDQSA